MSFFVFLVFTECNWFAENLREVTKCNTTSPSEVGKVNCSVLTFRH